MILLFLRNDTLIGFIVKLFFERILLVEYREPLLFAVLHPVLFEKIEVFEVIGAFNQLLALNIRVMYSYEKTISEKVVYHRERNRISLDKELKGFKKSEVV